MALAKYLAFKGSRIIGSIAVGIAAVLIGWWAIGEDWRALIRTMPTNSDVLFWSGPQRDAGFRMMDKLPVLIKARKIPGGGEPRALETGPPLSIGDKALDAYFEAQNLAALVILQNGKIRLERYGNQFDQKGRWTSFSVAKSFTSTLIGAAIKDGYIRSVQDPISLYLPGLAGSAYADVTLEQLLSMTSGIAWIEDYSDPTSDVARFRDQESEDGYSTVVSYMRQLKRAHPAGQVWNYSTGETNLIGELLHRATGKTLSAYLQEKIWGPYGMAQPASWLLTGDGKEISGCCLQATTRDFARFGQFILEDAKIAGASILPEGWLASAAAKLADAGERGGYGYQWWVHDGGAFAAQGIFGQAIFIDPARALVIASNANWSTALGHEGGERARRLAFFKTIQKAIDAETGMSNEQAEPKITHSSP